MIGKGALRRFDSSDRGSASPRGSVSPRARPAPALEIISSAADAGEALSGEDTPTPMPRSRKQQHPRLTKDRMFASAQSDGASCAFPCSAQLLLANRCARLTGDDYIDPDPDGLVPADIKATLDKDQVRGMRNVFDAFDGDSDGIVEPGNIGALLRTLGLITSRKMLRCIVEVVDINGDGEIDFGEFVTLMTQRSKVVEHDVDEDDGEEPPADLTASPRTLEALASPRQPKAEIQDAEEQAQAIRQFKRAISHLAFGSHMTANPTSQRAMEELDRVKAQLGVKKEMRTEWELQRVLIWMERFEFIQELPPAEDSDQRIDACRVLGVQEVEPGDRSVPSTRLAIVLCIFWAWRFAFADGAFPQDLPGRGQRRDDVLPAARFSGAEIEAAANGGRGGHPRPAADHPPAGGQELRRICRHEHLPGEPRKA